MLRFRKVWILIVVGIVICFFIKSNQALAVNVTLIKDVLIDKATIEKGFMFCSEDSVFCLAILPRSLKNETKFSIYQSDNSLSEYPQGWQPASNVFEVKSDLDGDLIIPVRIKLAESTKVQKKLFVWDEIKNSWQETGSSTVDQMQIKAKENVQNKKFVVLVNDIMEIGQASWYKYKNCDCAASPDYPKGTKLLVRNLDNNKEVIVKVNDFGPERNIFPDRIIDLDKVAFKKIGKTGAGVLKNILVCPLK